MSTTYKQDMDFIKEIIERDLLEDAIGWMNRNLEPEDVFDKDALKTWALSSGFVEDK